MVLSMLLIVAFIFILPSIVVTAIWAALAGGPLVLLGIVGLYLVFLGRKRKNLNIGDYKPKKPLTFKWKGQEIAVKGVMYSVLCTAVIAPVIIVGLVVFTPPFIALPLIFITAGVEIGRYCKQ